VILGQGLPVATVNDNEQMFVAPWVVPVEREVADRPEDTSNEETSSPKRSGPANLTNDDAEGWYELEKQWATFIPGFVPEPSEGD
jgi:hypothetical protein